IIAWQPESVGRCGDVGEAVTVCQAMIVDEPLQHPQLVDQQSSPGEAVTVCQAMIVDEPVGDAVVVPQQYAVNGAGCGNLFLARLGGNQFLKQLVDDWIGDPCIVPASLDIHLARMKVEPLFQARAE